MATSTSIDAHVYDKGATPIVRLTNWDDRITLHIKIGNAAISWYLEPLTGEKTDDYIERVIAELSDVIVDVPGQN